MVLKQRHDDFIAFADKLLAKGVCNQVDTFRGTPNKDNLIFA